MRKLATIQKILDIAPIEGADVIEVATIRGWKVVVAKKDNYQVGDLVVYCEVDSWIPHKLAPFLSKGQEPREFEGIKGERLRTVKLRGQVSQGLILPVTKEFELPPFIQHKDGNYQNVEEGMDVSDILGIIKYEPPVPAQLAGLIKGAFPSQTIKTDEERIQNLKSEYDRLSNMVFEVTEKLEGSSCQFGLINGEFVVCSRNLNLAETESNSMWQQVRRYDIEVKMRQYNLDGIMIQTEIVGEGIQGNHYKIKGQNIYVFAIYDTNTGQFLTPAQREEIVKVIGLKHVPVIGEFQLAAIGGETGLDPIESILSYADGMSLINPSVMREGVVFKQVDGQEHFKAVSNSYLIKTGG